MNYFFKRLTDMLCEWKKFYKVGALQPYIGTTLDVIKVKVKRIKNSNGNH